MAENIDDIVENSIHHIKNEEYDFSIITMGSPQDPGCFCPSNQLLRQVIEKILGTYQIILIDCEAGLEQIHRKIVQTLDYLLVITDMSMKSIVTAENIVKMAKTFIDIKDSGIIINKVRENHENTLINLVKDKNLKLVGTLPEDEEIIRLEIDYKPLLDISQNNGYLKKLDNLINFIFPNLS